MAGMFYSQPTKLTTVQMNAKCFALKGMYIELEIIYEVYGICL